MPCPSAACRQEQPDAVREKFVGALLRGVSAHHAGCLPGWKALVERLFQAGLLKVGGAEPGGGGGPAAVGVRAAGASCS
jgi:hypothetical protein